MSTLVVAEYQYGPKDITQLQTAIHFISSKLDELLPVRQEISQVLSVVKRLERENTEKDSKIKELELRLGDLEQYS